MVVENGTLESERDSTKQGEKCNIMGLLWEKVSRIFTLLYCDRD